MNVLMQWLSFMVLVMALATPAAGAPFASLVKIPEGIEDNLDVLSARNSTIPSREEVGLPPYPEAKIFFTQMNNRINEGGTWVDLPKRIFMGTSDTPEQVVEFYRKHLEGWAFGEFYGVPTFYRKKGEFRPMEDMITPRIVIGPEFRERKLMPEAKTTIDIYYNPAQ